MSFQELVNLAEEHPAITGIIGVLLTAILTAIGFILKNLFFKEKTESNEITNTSNSLNNAVSNSGSIGTLVQSVTEVLNPSKVQLISNLDNISDWEKTEDEPETWICKTIPDLKIVVTESASVFEEDWTKFVSRMGTHTEKVCVNLYYKNTRIESQMIFITLDDSRYRVALPERRQVRQEGEKYQWEYFWNEDSIEYKIMQIIGFFYHVYPSEQDFINAINQNEKNKFEN